MNKASFGASAHGSDLLERLVAVETDRDALCPPTNGGPDLRTALDDLMGELRPSANEKTAGPARVEALNHFIFDHFAFKASPDLKDPDNLFLSRVLERRRGYCVGLAALYLVLAERLGLPVFAVATPSHVFLRYDDGATRINIETLQQGANIADEQYVREQKIPRESVKGGVFMRNLTTGEFMAQVHNNLGVIYSERKDYERAAREYVTAIDLGPRLAAARYNLGNDLLARGDYRGAARQFSRSLRLYPTDAWALNNRGLALNKMGKRRPARRDFEAALVLEPAFEPARRNLEDLDR